MRKHKEELEEMLCDELDKIAQQGELTAGTLDTVQKLSHSLKSLKTIDAMDESKYSQAGMPYMYDGSNASNGRRNYSRAYEDYYDNSSYARGRYSNARGYSRDGEKDQLLSTIEEMKRTVERMEG